MRAREPDQDGYVERDGVKIAYEVFGTGEPTVLLMPTWSIIHSRFWKLQVPYLARHFRVVTFDGRGCGRSDRPVGPEAYADAEFAADALAVLDGTGTDQAVLVALSSGATWSIQVAAGHPERVLGVVTIGASVGLVPRHEERRRWSWNERHDTTDGWAKYNRHYWLEGGYESFLEFFFGQMFPEPHSTKQIEDCVGWGNETDPTTLINTHLAGLVRPAPPIAETGKLVRCPVLVIHGSEDHISSARERRRPRRTHRWHARHGRRRWARAACAGPGAGQPARQGLRQRSCADPDANDVDAGAASAEARALLLVADRPRSCQA